MKLKISAFLGLSLVLVAGWSPAQAQVVWVMNNGSDISNNTCSSAAPCLTFADAISVAGGTGEVACVNPGTYATSGTPVPTITQSLIINCPGGVIDGSSITISGSNNSVVLRGISINGEDGPGNGISVTGGTILALENVQVFAF
jgi:hypothetical protein